MLIKLISPGISCLQHACFYNHVRIVKLLLEHGADPYLKDIFGRLPIDVCHSKEVKDLLIANM
jgi:ankyrin repeat protein